MKPDRKRPGRPRLDPHGPNPSARVLLSLPDGEYQKAARVAARDRESVQDVIRRGLRRLLQTDTN